MSPDVRDVFFDTLDLSGPDRERYFADHAVSPEVRAEVESLLQFDARRSHGLTDSILRAVEDVLDTGRPAPTHCGPYKLVRTIGTGGMGAVYLAERVDGEIRRQAAVKLLRADVERPGWRDRFLRERQLLANLDHPSIARLLDAGHSGDRPYLVMEYVEGVPIDAYAANLEIRDRLRLFLKVCEGVSHAHRRLIIHRDLKPSNILVDAAGQPKLLDFGIAKVLSESGDATRTVERMMTPNYASPEQLRGSAQTTATDIYSLGAVLFRILTGAPPHDGMEQAMEIASGAKSIPSALQLNPALPRDLDFVLRKALRLEPEQRYTTVDELAADLRAFLDHKPVLARAADKWYVAGKLLRRYWLPAAAASVTLLGLTAGLLVANAERAKAEKRFQQMRHLAGQVLKLDELVSGLQGSTRARHQIIRISKEYLEALRADARHDQTLAVEIGNSYVHLAGAQGLPTHSNLGNSQEAEDSLRKAESIVDQVIASSPSNGKALLTSAEIAEGRMILADSSRRDSQTALAQGRKAASRLDARLKLGGLTGDDKAATARILFNVALMHKNLDLLQDAVRYARTAASIVPSSPNGLLRATEGLGLMADSLRMIGDLEGASQAMRQAWAAFHKLPEDGRHWLTRYLLHWREAVILGGGSGGLNLDRPGEALASIGQAWQLIDQAAGRDANDSRARILFAQTAREFGALLTPGDPARALAVFDTGIRRLGEVTKNPRARRGEAELLARSSYPLRRLNRPAEAQDRIRKAAAILTELGNYPPATVRPTGDDATVLRASADHLAETGRTREATSLYQQLLDKITASQTGPEKNLRYAGAVSSLYAALADSHRRSGHAAEARAWSARRLTLWQHWNRQLPANPYIARQLAECER